MALSSTARRLEETTDGRRDSELDPERETRSANSDGLRGAM